MGALDSIVRSGKALYVGISSYSSAETQRACAVLRNLGTPCLIHQPSYSIFNRWVEEGLLETLVEEGRLTRLDEERLIARARERAARLR